MKFNEIPAESLKVIAVILQQKATLTTTHQRATKELAFFLMEVNNTDRYIHMDEKQKRKTIKALKESVRHSAEGLELVNQLEVD